jgi:hypothetical protein
VIDPNLEHGLTYKDIQYYCKKSEVEFTNQSFSHLIKQLKKRFLETRPDRATSQPRRSASAYLIRLMDAASYAANN